MSAGASIPLKEEEIYINRGENKIRWTIDQPRLEYHYCIYW
jgi:hypothetical protein